MSVYDFTVTDNKGNSVSLKKYEGKVLLIVNTATRCGLTPQYEGLEALYEKYRDQGFEILDFPCNQFAFQAPGDAEKIDSFCKLKYGTKFPRFAKIKVNGSGADPLYVYLKATPHNPRLTPLHAICLPAFRHITQILLAGRQPACVEFRQSDENLDFASDAQGSCGVALKNRSPEGSSGISLNS